MVSKPRYHARRPWVTQRDLLDRIERVGRYSAPGPVGGCVDVCGCVCVRASVAHRCLPTVRRRVGHAVVAEEAAYYSTAVV